MLKIPGRRAAFVSLMLAAAIAALPARDAGAAEISVLLGNGSPGTAWGTLWGGMLTITLFNIVHGDVEGAKQAGAVEGTDLYTVAAKAYLGPSFGRLVPYAGLGAGLYHESLPAGSDNGTTGLVFIGVKLKFPMGLVLRGEYQWVDMPDAAPVQLDKRYFVAAGLSF